MTEDTKNTYYKANPAVSARLMGDRGAVLFDADAGQEKVINPTGAFIWAQLDGSRKLSDIVTELQQHFDGVSLEQVADDVAAFLDEIKAAGFVSTCSGRSRATSTPAAFVDVTDAPQSLDLSLTGRCNLHCDYCFYHKEMKSRPDLPLEAWLTFFEELGCLAVRDVCLSGGEVFVRPDFWELVDGAIANRLRYSILTNGTMITGKMLAQFESGFRRRRMDSIQVSMDGSRAEVHDKSRGAGSFKKAVRGLRLLKEAGFPVTVRVTINQYNVDDLDSISRLLLDEIGLNSFSTNDAVPMGAGCENQRSIVLTPAQQVTAMKTLARLAVQYDGRIIAAAGPLAKWRIYQEMEHARATGEMTARWQMGCLTACGCVYDKLSVHHDGMMTPCSMLSKLVLGHINRESLTNIWKTHPVLQSLKGRHRIPMTVVPGCEDCEWALYCNGSCPGPAYEMTGDLNRANSHDCYRRFLQETGGMDFSLPEM